jgi:MYXO-CTERM domain-containing protein
VFTNDSTQVTIQNCSGAPIMLVPSIDPPFSIDATPPFPMALSSGATAAFGVSFHPTHPGTFTGTLSIATSATTTDLTVSLSGTSTVTTPYLDAGSGSGTEPAQTSFYACSCAAHDPRGGWPLALALVIALRPRRTQRRRSIVLRTPSGSAARPTSVGLAITVPRRTGPSSAR